MAAFTAAETSFAKTAMGSQAIAAAKSAVGAELSHDDIVAHGGALLGMFTNLSASSEEIASKLHASPSLLQLVKDDLKSGPRARTDAVRASLLERAKDALNDKEKIGFEQALRKKDATPCACMMIDYMGAPLIDLDRQAGFGNCESACLNNCKYGDSRFHMDSYEALQLGAEGVTQPVVGGQCKWGSCNCLDATQSVYQINSAKSSIGYFDPAYQLQVFGTEFECMQSCGNACPDMNGINYEGLCLDEVYGD